MAAKQEVADVTKELGVFRKKPVTIRACRTRHGETIKTLEGDMVASPGDWIITGIKGERYPCKDDIFRESYEPVNAQADRLWTAKSL